MTDENTPTQPEQPYQANEAPPAGRPAAPQPRPNTNPPKPAPKSKKKLFRILAVIVVVLIGVAIYVALHWNEQTTDDASFDGHVVTLSPKVAGYVKVLHIDDNQLVKAGDVLLEIDPTDYINRRDRAQANLQAAMAGRNASSRSLETTRVSAPSNLDAARAQLASAQANWQKAVNDLKRFQHLSNEARSMEQLDAAIAAEKTARASLEDAKAKLRSAETAPKVIQSAQANEEVQAAQVKQAQADLAQAEKDLADTKVIAPIDGRITRRGVEQGDYVQPGQQLGSLVGSEFWVIANYKETQLKHMQLGDKVDIRIDAYPGVKLTGKINSFQAGTGSRFTAFPPENATGNFIKIVQRVPVKILLDRQPDPKLDIGPGMSVEPIVYTK